mgnify:CR=1 FL=1
MTNVPQKPQLILTACNFDTRQTQNGTKVNVWLVFNDLIYVKAELKFKKDGGMWLEIANSPWQKDGKWNNNFKAGFINDDFKKNLEAQVIANYQSGQTSIVMPNMRTNYDTAKYMHPKAPQQPPVQGQQQYQQQPPAQQPPANYAPQGYAQQPPPGYGYNNNNSQWNM